MVCRPLSGLFPVLVVHKVRSKSMKTAAAPLASTMAATSSPYGLTKYAGIRLRHVRQFDIFEISRDLARKYGHSRDIGYVLRNVQLFQRLTAFTAALSTVIRRVFVSFKCISGNYR
jgi:hypothetical protein